MDYNRRQIQTTFQILAFALMFMQEIKKVTTAVTYIHTYIQKFLIMRNIQKPDQGAENMAYKEISIKQKTNTILIQI